MLVSPRVDTYRYMSALNDMITFFNSAINWIDCTSFHSWYRSILVSPGQAAFAQKFVHNRGSIFDIFKNRTSASYSLWLYES